MFCININRINRIAKIGFRTMKQIYSASNKLFRIAKITESNEESKEQKESEERKRTVVKSLNTNLLTNENVSGSQYSERPELLPRFNERCVANDELEKQNSFFDYLLKARLSKQLPRLPGQEIGATVPASNSNVPTQRSPRENKDIEAANNPSRPKMQRRQPKGCEIDETKRRKKPAKVDEDGGYNYDTNINTPRQSTSNMNRTQRPRRTTPLGCEIEVKEQKVDGPKYASKDSASAQLVKETVGDNKYLPQSRGPVFQSLQYIFLSKDKRQF